MSFHFHNQQLRKVLGAVRVDLVYNRRLFQGFRIIIPFVTMWLINARTLQLEEVWGEKYHSYAILSHRWEDGEVSFRDMQNLAVATKMKGFAKIRHSCELALGDEQEYVWIDTCCINKESSAELSEAINSMYRWYQASAVCYAHLLDVRDGGSDKIGTNQQIMDSVWFARGWTLQELLAPPNLRFYDGNWNVLGTKQTLGSVLRKVTGIDENILSGEDPLESRSIAQRMSWASRRKTTRKEDMAYCLLGIFDVNIPLLYGEGGKKAFLRLQEEIIKHSDDHTIFAWSISRSPQPGLLAPKPKAFEKCHSMRDVGMRAARSPFSMTNRGLSIKLLATPWTVDTYLVRLDCADASSLKEPIPLDQVRLGIFLRRLHEDDQFARVKCEGKTFVQLSVSTWTRGLSNQVFQGAPSQIFPTESQPVELLEINVRQKLSFLDKTNVDDRVNGFRIATYEAYPANHPRYKLGYRTTTESLTVSASNWDPGTSIMTMEPGICGTTGAIDISAQNLEIKLIKLGFDFSFNPVCFIADRYGLRGHETANHRGQWSQDRCDQYFLGIHQRRPFDTGAWSTVNNKLAAELEHHPGLWALKGDRINGLDVQAPKLGTVQIFRGIIKDKVVWDVHLNLPGLESKEGILRRVFK